MRISLDANEANAGSRVGTGQYTFNILTHWAKQTNHDYTLYLRDSPLSDLPPSGENWQYRQIGPRKAWTRLALPLHLLFSRPRPDVFWNPAHYLPPMTGCPSVVTIHDLAYELFPDLFLPSDLYKLRRWTRRSVRIAARVIAVSQSTKADLIRFYSVPENKIVVVHNGYDQALFHPQIKPDKAILTQYGLAKHNYLLYVSTIQPRKNVIKLVQAFRLLKEGGYPGKLVLAGRIGWLADETLQAIRESPDHEDIVMTGYVSDHVRQTLYSQADVHVLPSLYEGFGVSLLEAMASATPVVAADNSSLPEVVGQAGILFNAADPADLSESVLLARKDRDKLVKLGLRQAAKFSWEKCAAETLAVLEQVAKGSRK